VKRFAFELEKLLELRTRREREAEIALGRAAAAVNALEGQLRDLARERQAGAAGRFAPGNRAADILVYERYLRRLDQTREKLLAEAARAELALGEARELFIEASREKKVLEKLRERRLGEYRRQARREEAQILDDVAGGAAARQNLRNSPSF
jgi:flagellar FliJ protein